MKRRYEEHKPLSFRNGCAYILLGFWIVCMFGGLIVTTVTSSKIDTFNLQLFNYAINSFLWGIGLAVAGRVLYKDDEND